MYTKMCRCGIQTKNFHMDIGEFFIDECCEKAGYDALGNKPVTKEQLAPSPVETITTPETEKERKKREKAQAREVAKAAKESVATDESTEAN